MQKGLWFEARFIEELKKSGCRIKTSRYLDHIKKVDLIISELPELELKIPAQIQLTFQGNNLFKLEKYLRTRRGSRSTSAHFYVVISTNCSPKRAVKKLLNFLNWKYRLRPICADVYGVFLEARGKWNEFSPKERLAWLKKRADPSETAAKRSVGVITMFNSGGFFVQTKSGKKERKKPFFAFYADVADKDLSVRIGRLRRRGVSYPDPEISVSFYRHVNRKEKRALSVISFSEN